MKRALLALSILTLACDGQINLFGSPTQIQQGQPKPSPSASATPTPSPTPSPSPSATPQSLCELLPPSTATSCKVDQPLLDYRVSLAANALKPPIPTTEASYIDALLLAMRSQGLCAAHHPTASDEIIVKMSNTYSETYDVWNAAQYPQVLYVQTCTPAKF